MFLSKRSNGVYYVFYTNADRKRTCISTKTKKKNEAFKFLSNFQNEIKQRQINKTTPINLKEFIWQFLKYSESLHTPKTTNAFKTTFKFLVEYFGNISLLELTEKRINEFLQHRINSSSIYSARKDLINISSSLTKAVSENYLLENPCKKIKRIRIPEKQPLFFSEIDFEVLLRNIDNHIIKAISVFAVNTGLRQGEIISLEWNQINFKDKYIILDNRNHLTKSKKIRTIPLNIKALQVLTELELNKNGQFVFNDNGNKLKQEFVSKAFKDFVIKSKLNPQLHFHSLRHTFASWLVQKGVSIFEVSKLLGHSDLKVTQIYSHLRTEDLRNSVNILCN